MAQIRRRHSKEGAPDPRIHIYIYFSFGLVLCVILHLKWPFRFTCTSVLAFECKTLLLHWIHFRFMLGNIIDF